MRGSRSQTDRNSLEQRTPLTLGHPFIKVGQCIHVEGCRRNRGKLSSLIDQKREGSQKDAAERSITGFPIFHPNSREPEHANRKQEDSHQLHQHVPHLQTNNIRQQRDPLVSQRWIGRLREAPKPLLVPWIKPMLRIVRSEKHVEVRIE